MRDDGHIKFYVAGHPLLYWIGDSQGVFAQEMTCVVPNGTLNATHSLTHWSPAYTLKQTWPCSAPS